MPSEQLAGVLSTSIGFGFNFSCIFVTLEQSLDKTKTDTKALCQLAVRTFLIVVSIDDFLPQVDGVCFHLHESHYLV